jgi:hypothetical protein
MSGRPDMMTRAPQAGVVYLALLILLASQAASAQDKSKGSIVKEGDVTIVKNPKEPIYKTPILELKEELSIGGPEASGEAVFARMGEFDVDDAGNFYISAARGDDHIRVFDRSGRYLRTIGRHGQGPGDIDGIGPLSFVRTTGELAVTNLRRRCLTFFKADGAYVRDLRFEDPGYSTSRLDSKGRIYAAGGLFDTEASYYEVRLAALDPEGKAIRILAKSPGQVKGKIGIWMPNMPWAIDSSDNLIVGQSKEYELQVFKAGTHELLMRIRKAFDPVPISDEELKRFKKPENSAMPYEFAKQHAAFWTFFTSDTGLIFVATFEKADNGHNIHDVFDKDGRLLARFPLRSQGLKISGGKYYALEEDEDGYQYVKRYALTWKIK